jgi:hypothetical protein
VLVVVVVAVNSYRLLWPRSVQSWLGVSGGGSDALASCKLCREVGGLRLAVVVSR